jgi:cyclic pyranopterin phosphate synthase
MGRRVPARRVEKSGHLSHFDPKGRVRMVDVTRKPATRRTAVAAGFVRIAAGALRRLPENPKGDPLEIARIAGIAAAKRTWELIPLCHPLPLSHIDVRASVCENGVDLVSTVTTTAATGVEMEALTAVSVAALTVYDMCKAVDPAMEITGIVLLEKRGGRRGTYRRS